jgi:hypothetical protein
MPSGHCPKGCAGLLERGYCAACDRTWPEIPGHCQRCGEAAATEVCGTCELERGGRHPEAHPTIEGLGLFIHFVLRERHTRVIKVGPRSPYRDRFEKARG